MIAVFKKEMRSYFTGVIGYVFLVAYLLFVGATFCYTTFFSMSSDVTSFFTITMLASAVLLPILTMKSFAEERKVRTEQLLLTSPVSITGIVMGKFLAAYTVFAACMLLNSVYFVFLVSYCSLKFAILLGNLVAMLLVGAVYIAIGLFVSSLTENQLTAAIGTIGIIFVFLAIGLISSLLPSAYVIRYIFDFVSIFTRFQGFTAGYLDIASLIYYISLAGIFLYLTVRIYDRRRYS